MIVVLRSVLRISLTFGAQLKRLPSKLRLLQQKVGKPGQNREKRPKRFCKTDKVVDIYIVDYN